jgi:hypothetical protein
MLIVQIQDLGRHFIKRILTLAVPVELWSFSALKNNMLHGRL